MNVIKTDILHMILNNMLIGLFLCTPTDGSSVHLILGGCVMALVIVCTVSIVYLMKKRKRLKVYIITLHNFLRL